MKLYNVFFDSDECFTALSACFLTREEAESYVKDLSIVVSGKYEIEEWETGRPEGHDKPVKYFWLMMDVNSGNVIRSGENYMWSGNADLIKSWNKPHDNFPVTIYAYSFIGFDDAENIAEKNRAIYMDRWEKHCATNPQFRVGYLSGKGQ